MKIGIISVVGGYSWAGSEEMWKIFAIEALRSGHSVAVSAKSCIAASEELSDYREMGGKIFAYKPLNWVMRRIVSRGMYSRFAPMMEWKPDIICISGGAPDMIKEYDLVRCLQTYPMPKVYIIQGNEEGWIGGDWQRNCLKPLYTSAERIICVSRSNATLLERQLATALPNLTVIPNPIRTPMKTPLEWPNDCGQLRLATVGRYEVGSKCQDRTLEALATPEWKNRNWHLSLYGSGPDENYLRDLIQYYGLQSHVSLEGFERDFKKIWSDNHLHLLNSRAEGLALALIESMFCGRPAVITRSGGNHEILRDGIDGFVSPGETPGIIRNTLEHAWTNRDKWRHMGDSAFQRATNWVPEDLSTKLLKVITGA